MTDRLLLLDELRARGWSVAIHNDYRQGQTACTFWLLTHPNGRWVKSESDTDEAALAHCRQQIERYSYEGVPGSLTLTLDGPTVTMTFMDKEHARRFTRWLEKAVA